ncbi:MAG TPA: hemerythrin domain-containing protein [Chitinophagaceae bacterium]
MKYFFYSLLLVLFIGQCGHKEENPVTQFHGKPEVPSSIKKEHENLLDQIHRITLFRDSAGLVAIKLNDLMQHHFKEEEDFALPPLGLLSLLASGKIPEQSNEIILLTDKLPSQLTHLGVEHQLIKAFMDELRQADTNGSHPEIIEFEKELHKHANTEEEVFFPAAILIGEYLKLKVTRKP